MKEINTLLLTDFYKATHHVQYPEGVEYITSYFVPRMSRLKRTSKVVHFGLMGVIKDYLIDNFNQNFFNRDREEVLSEYYTILSLTLGEKPAADASKRVAELHDLGYLPISIKALNEGQRVAMGVPTFSITNTHPRFAWMVNALETLLSTSLWHKMVSATVGDEYAKIVEHYGELTMDEGNPLDLLGDFSFRGQESVESGIGSSAGFLAAGFTKTATIPAILYVDKYYNDEALELNEIGKGSVSTEHSVMCSNYSVDEDEETFIRKLLVELYPETPFSMVADSYDYWRIVDEVIPSMKDIITARDVPLLVRGDSGDPVEIVTETVRRFWKTFGGRLNSKGFKVLDPSIRVIYGDSITLERAERIYEILYKEGFSIENVVLGVGSFSMQAIEQDGELAPFTRDTFGIAIKATHALMKDGSEIFILKDPKTDTGNFKKSHKGLVQVFKDESGELYAVDKVHQKDFVEDEMSEVFRDGKMLKKANINEIREKMRVQRQADRGDD